jgi:competence protein ComEC
MAALGAGLIVGLLILCCGALADMEVHFLDIGQGDCAILVADGEAMIIDGGPGSHSRKVYSYIQDTLGLEGIRYMVASHPHEDHVGGLVAAMNAAPVEAILTPVLESDLPQFQDLMAYAEMSGTQVVVPQEGDQFALGNAVFTVLARWPDATQVCGFMRMAASRPTL